MDVKGARIWAVVVSLAALGTPMGVSAQELWNGTSLGMAPADVQKVFPKAAQGERSVDGDDLILRVPALHAGGHDATAFFDFTGGRLRTVALLLSQDRPGAAIDTEEIRTQLSSKYGPRSNATVGSDASGATAGWT